VSSNDDPQKLFEAEKRLDLYEVRCLGCNVSFPPGTRRCLHCGERIGRPAPVETGLPVPLQAGEAEEEMAGGSAARTALWAVTALIAMAGSLFRTCQGG
jgi:hypothetical protein